MLRGERKRRKQIPLKRHANRRGWTALKRNGRDGWATEHTREMRPFARWTVIKIKAAQRPQLNAFRAVIWPRHAYNSLHARVFYDQTKTHAQQHARSWAPGCTTTVSARHTTDRNKSLKHRKWRPRACSRKTSHCPRKSRTVCAELEKELTTSAAAAVAESLTSTGPGCWLRMKRSRALSQNASPVSDGEGYY